MNVLLIEPENRLSEPLMAGFQNRQARVQRVSDPTVADSVLEAFMPEVIICNYYLKGDDGLSLFLKWQNRPILQSVPFVLLYDRKDYSVLKDIFDSGVDDVIQLPCSFDEIWERLQILLGEMGKKESYTLTSNGISGALGEINFLDMIQLIEKTKKTGILRITRGQKLGEIFFQTGNIRKVIQGTLSGPEAFFEILVWEEGTFRMDFVSFLEIEEPASLTNEDWLTSGMTFFEKWNQLLLRLPSLDRVLIQNRPEVKTFPGTEEGRIIGFFEKPRSIREYLETNTRPSLDQMVKIEQMLKNSTLSIVSHKTEADKKSKSKLGKKIRNIFKRKEIKKERISKEPIIPTPIQKLTASEVKAIEKYFNTW